MMMVNSSPTTIKHSNVNNISSTSLELKAWANLSLLFNLLNNFSSELKNEPEKFVK